MARVSLALGGESEPFNVDMTFSDVQDLLGSLKEASSVLELMLEEEEEGIETNSDEPPQQWLYSCPDITHNTTTSGQQG